ncbi:uncharacterized protein LOC62_04G006417 [Vanrija pseudolonga]|uniref:Uncharacterized protein n=1 Tax=Vanrija pseudolonga TaxID=143232 RepID=A0AAF0YBI8_9TREE|nr:hypothetical protein LOC62_04G006417 [Vanrija pseudolonga]
MSLADTRMPRGPTPPPDIPKGFKGNVYATLRLYTYRPADGLQWAADLVHLDDDPLAPLRALGSRDGERRYPLLSVMDMSDPRDGKDKHAPFSDAQVECLHVPEVARSSLRDDFTAVMSAVNACRVDRLSLTLDHDNQDGSGAADTVATLGAFFELLDNPHVRAVDVRVVDRSATPDPEFCAYAGAPALVRRAHGLTTLELHKDVLHGVSRAMDAETVVAIVDAVGKHNNTLLRVHLGVCSAIGFNCDTHFSCCFDLSRFSDGLKVDGRWDELARLSRILKRNETETVRLRTAAKKVLVPARILLRGRARTPHDPPSPLDTVRAPPIARQLRFRRESAILTNVDGIATSSPEAKASPLQLRRMSATLLTMKSALKPKHKAPTSPRLDESRPFPILELPANVIRLVLQQLSADPGALTNAQWTALLDQAQDPRSLGLLATATRDASHSHNAIVDKMDSLRKISKEKFNKAMNDWMANGELWWERAPVKIEGG